MAVNQCFGFGSLFHGSGSDQNKNTDPDPHPNPSYYKIYVLFFPYVLGDCLKAAIHD